MRHNANVAAELGQDVHKKYRDALERSQGGHENDNTGGLPPYILAGTPEAATWRRNHPDGTREKIKSFATGSTPGHRYASQGQTRELAEYLKDNKDAVNARDENGWTPLVERYGVAPPWTSTRRLDYA